MGFTFPGGTSLQDTGSCASRDHFPTASSCIKHRTLLPTLGSTRANRPGSERKHLMYSAYLSSSPFLWGPGRTEHTQDWAVPVRFGGSQWMLRGHPHSTNADSMCFSFFSNISKRYLNFSMKKTELAKF